MVLIVLSDVVYSRLPRLPNELIQVSCFDSIHPLVALPLDAAFLCAWTVVAKRQKIHSDAGAGL